MHDLKFGEKIDIILNDFTEIKALIGLNHSVCSVVSGAHIGELRFDGRIEKEGIIIGRLE